MIWEVCTGPLSSCCPASRGGGEEAQGEWELARCRSLQYPPPALAPAKPPSAAARLPLPPGVRRDLAHAHAAARVCGPGRLPGGGGGAVRAVHPGRPGCAAQRQVGCNAPAGSSSTLHHCSCPPSRMRLRLLVPIRRTSPCPQPAPARVMPAQLSSALLTAGCPWNGACLGRCMACPPTCVQGSGGAAGCAGWRGVAGGSSARRQATATPWRNSMHQGL